MRASRPGTDRRPGPRAGGGDLDGVTRYLRHLDRALHGPRRAKAELLAEVRDSLHDAAEAYRHEGLSPAQAGDRAVAEFGPVAELAPAYQDELAIGATRALVLRTALAYTALTGGSVLMWWGAPWTGAEPPSDYLLLADWLDRLGYALVVLTLLTYVWLGWTARRGRTPDRVTARVVGTGVAALLGLTALGGTLVYAWSVRLHSAASTWPPMAVGSILILVMYGWLGRAAWSCLRSGRAPDGGRAR